MARLSCFGGRHLDEFPLANSARALGIIHCESAPGPLHRGGDGTLLRRSRHVVIGEAVGACRHEFHHLGPDLGRRKTLRSVQSRLREIVIERFAAIG